jgi:hypothetical protein
VTGLPKPVIPADGSTLSVVLAFDYLPRVTVRPLVAPTAVYGATATLRTTGSEDPPLAQLTLGGTVTAVTPVLTVTNTAGNTV